VAEPVPSELVRRQADVQEIECPPCGQRYLQQELSTFAAHANGGPQSAEMPAYPGGHAATRGCAA